MVDTVFVGQTHDPYQMNAVSMATPIFMILMAVGNLFGVGGSAFISRSLGAREYERVKKISSFSFWGALAVGLLATFLMTVGVDWLLPVLGADAKSNIAAITLEKGSDATSGRRRTAGIWSSTHGTICSTSVWAAFPPL